MLIKLPIFYFLLACNALPTGRLTDIYEDRRPSIDHISHPIYKRGYDRNDLTHDLEFLRDRFTDSADAIHEAISDSKGRISYKKEKMLNLMEGLVEPVPIQEIEIVRYNPYDTTAAMKYYRGVPVDKRLIDDNEDELSTKTNQPYGDIQYPRSKKYSQIITHNVTETSNIL